MVSPAELAVRVRSGSAKGSPVRLILQADAGVASDAAAAVVRALAVHGLAADRVEIRWQAGDVGFVETPIALYYSEKTTGQWKPVATRLQNKGSSGRVVSCLRRVLVP